MLVPCLQCNNLSKEYTGGHQLEKEARKWATKIAKETKAIREHQRLLKAVGNGDKVGGGSHEKHENILFSKQYSLEY